MLNNKLTNILNIFTVLYKFRIRVPRDIFTKPTNYYFIIIIVLYREYKKYEIPFNKNNYLTRIGTQITTWVNASYETVIDIIADLPG